MSIETFETESLSFYSIAAASTFPYDETTRTLVVTQYGSVSEVSGREAFLQNKNTAMVTHIINVPTATAILPTYQIDRTVSGSTKTYYIDSIKQNDLRPGHHMTILAHEVANGI